MANRSDYTDGEAVADRALEQADLLKSEGKETAQTVASRGRMLHYGITAAALAAAGVGTCMARAHAAGAQEGSEDSGEAPLPSLAPISQPSHDFLVPLVSPMGDEDKETKIKFFKAFIVSPEGQEQEFDPTALPPEGDAYKWQFVIECDSSLESMTCTAITDELLPTAFMPAKSVSKKGTAETGERKLLRFTLGSVYGKTVIAGKDTPQEARFVVVRLEKPAPPVPVVKSEPGLATSISGDEKPADGGAPLPPPDAGTAPEVRIIEIVDTRMIPEPPVVVETGSEWTVFAGAEKSVAGRGAGNAPDAQAIVGVRYSLLAVSGGRFGVEIEGSYGERKVPVAVPSIGRSVGENPETFGRSVGAGASFVAEKPFHERDGFAQSIFGGAGLGAEWHTFAARPDFAYDRTAPQMLSLAEGSTGIIPDVRAQVGACLQLWPVEVCAGVAGRHGFRNVQQRAGDPKASVRPYAVSPFFRAGYRSRNWR